MALGLLPCVSPSSRAEATSAFHDHAVKSRAEGFNGRVITVTNEARIQSLFSATCDAFGVEVCDDIVPVLFDLSKLKAGMGVANGLARTVPDDAPGATRDVLKIVYGFTSMHQTGRDGGSLVPENLAPLLKFADAPMSKSDLVAFGRLLWQAGVDPAVMTTSDVLYAAAREMPVAMDVGSAHAAMATYRRLRLRAIAVDPELAKRFGLLPDGRHTKGSGLLAVLSKSDIPEHARLGKEGDLKKALLALAPKLHAQVAEFVADGLGMRNRPLVSTSLDGMWNTAGSVATALYKQRPELLADFEVSDLWEKSVEVAPSAAVTKSHSVRFIPTGVTLISVPLSRWVIDQIAEASRIHTGKSSGYPGSVLHQLVYMWTITERLYGNDLRSVNLPMWQDWSTQHTSIREHMRANPVPRDEVVRKGSAARMQLISMPHVLCVGAPLLGREAERLLRRLERMEQAALRAGYEDVTMAKSVKAAAREFELKAECYIAFVLPWALGLRNAQYLNGLYGRHFSIDYSELGEPLCLRCSYDGELHDAARIKQGTANGRILGPGVLNLRVLVAYLERVRAPRLRRLGAIEEEALAPNGRWPLFVGRFARSLAHCGMSSSLYRRDRFGATLYRVATEFLGREIEPYIELDRTKTWNSAWATHDIRKDMATILGELMGDWKLACAVTSDTEAVLKQKYVVHGFLPGGRRGDWQNIHTYLPHAVELLRNPADALCPLDDPTLVMPPNVIEILERWADEDRTNAARAKRSTFGVADAHLRRPRKRKALDAG